MTIGGQYMNRDSKTQHITLATVNVFSDLGFAAEAAAALAASLQQVISEKLAISESLETEGGGQDRSVVETPSSEDNPKLPSDR